MHSGSTLVLKNDKTIDVPDHVNVSSVTKRGVLRELAAAKCNRYVFDRLVGYRLKSGSFM
jgi:hypothetical protein